MGLAELYRLNGRDEEAAAEVREAGLYHEAARRLLPKFARVYVCSKADAERLRPDVPGELLVVPNAIRRPADLPARTTSRPYTFLFVGTLGYLPNEDAVRYFCLEVLPLIRERAPRSFHVRVVGSGMPSALSVLASIPEVRLVGEVDDVGSEYAEADAVVVPIRGGGGTRIKILEAFAYRRPVISTALGIEGIAATPERDFLLGDTPGEFAAQCARLMADAGLAEALVDHADGLLERHYTQARINRLVTSWR
jgi:glycosyltransferase involved in cell wall biosynthesis